MRRLAVVLSLVMLLGAGLLAVASGALAQDDTEGHPLVGGWLVISDTSDPTGVPETVVFHDDGTLVNVSPGEEEGEGQEVTLGVWEPTGERTANILFTSPFSPEMGEVGAFTVRASLEVSEDGNSFSGQYTIAVTGIPEAEGEYGPETVTATRITVEAMGTPVGPTSELFGAFEEGTPEATPVASPTS
jgi:hypothetical protein